MSNVFDLPTETIELPSLGLLYAETDPLSSGKVEIKYPTAKEEDILTNSNLLSKGIAIDTFLKSIIVDKTIDLDNLLPGDKTALEIAARILGYGKNYSFDYDGKKVTVDISTFKEIRLNPEEVTRGLNEFSFHMPVGKIDIKYQLITGKIEKQMKQELDGLRKLSKDYSASVTTLLKYAIIEVNGNRDKAYIKSFVEKMIMADSYALRQDIAKRAPGYIWEADGVTETGDVLEGISVPYTVNFFWP